mmetsp:Transcript_93696/g.303381  ORF Transcript_93696/g.303381 Transcript_93696/m.303381 type:complete len:191 (-) Transcript_93696:26-598(-)
MLGLAVRFKASEYRTMQTAVKGAMLEGMSSSARETRYESKGFRPPQGGSAGGPSGDSAPGSSNAAASPSGASPGATRRLRMLWQAQARRRLEEASMGGFTLQDDGTEMFQRYYAACAPKRCVYSTLEVPNPAGLLMLLSGLVGGLVTAGRSGGLAMVVVCRFLVKLTHRDGRRIGSQDLAAAVDQLKDGT